MIYDWILTNRESLKIIYALVVCFICVIIVLKTDRLFKLSDYQGLRFLRNSFFFYGLAFVFRFILGGTKLFPSFGDGYFMAIGVIFEFFVIVAGLFLFYSLTWKYFEKKSVYHSLLNIRAFVFYFLALLIIILNLFLHPPVLVHLSQIVLFFIMGIISLKNYLNENKKYRFLKNYFFAIILGLLFWVIDFVLRYFSGPNSTVQIVSYGINSVFFLVFLYGVIRITRTK